MSAPFTIHDLTDHAGHWTAAIHVGDARFPVDRKHGSWQMNTGPEGAGRADVRPGVAAVLQERVRRLERAAKREDTAA